MKNFTTNCRLIGWWCGHITLLLVCGVLLQKSAAFAWSIGREAIQNPEYCGYLILTLASAMVALFFFWSGNHVINTMRVKVHAPPFAVRVECAVSGFGTLRRTGKAMATNLEERLKMLEARLDMLQLMREKRLAPTGSKAQKRGYQAVAGTFADDPLYDDAMRRGREWRESQCSDWTR